MAAVRKSLEEILARKPQMDRAKIEATTDDDIARQIADDPDLAPELDVDAMLTPQFVRKQLGMTQEEFAAALRIPVATLRNWEQGRVMPDPAARSLLLIVARNPKAALEALAA